MAIRNFEAELEREILDKIQHDGELRRKTKEFAEDVRDTARRIALMDMDKGYATGKFVESIHVARRRNARGQFQAGPAWRVESNDDKANLLEYGTGVDAPGGHATWVDLDGVRHWGPNTPTPAYATFAKTALHYGGTSDGA
jgi:predicted phage gp36 major capsid-like protein